MSILWAFPRAQAWCISDTKSLIVCVIEIACGWQCCAISLTPPASFMAMTGVPHDNDSSTTFGKPSVRDGRSR